MSIAISAIVRPSLRLCLLQAGLLASVATAALAGLGLPWPLASAAAGLLAGLAARAALHRTAKARHIDISGVGQIRLTVYQGMARQLPGYSGSAGSAPQLVRLMAGSTLWPGLLLLRLQRPDGVVEALVLLPDSVPADAFRPLAVALRAIAVRGGESGDRQKN